MDRTYLVALSTARPAEARAEVLDAYRRAEYMLGKCADTLGVSYRTLARIVARLGLEPDLDGARRAAGLPILPRPPRGPRRVQCDSDVAPQPLENAGVPLVDVFSMTR